MTKPKEHPEVKHGKKGVLLVTGISTDSSKLLDVEDIQRVYGQTCD